MIIHAWAGRGEYRRGVRRPRVLTSAKVCKSRQLSRRFRYSSRIRDKLDCHNDQEDEPLLTQARRCRIPPPPRPLSGAGPGPVRPRRPAARAGPDRRRRPGSRTRTCSRHLGPGRGAGSRSDTSGRQDPVDQRGRRAPDQPHRPPGLRRQERRQQLQRQCRRCAG